MHKNNSPWVQLRSVSVSSVTINESKMEFIVVVMQEMCALTYVCSVCVGLGARLISSFGTWAGHRPGRRARPSWEQVELVDGWKQRREIFVPQRKSATQWCNQKIPQMRQTNIKVNLKEIWSQRKGIRWPREGYVETMTMIRSWDEGGEC